jgi:hypothetical protein
MYGGEKLEPLHIYPWGLSFFCDENVSTSKVNTISRQLQLKEERTIRDKYMSATRHQNILIHSNVLLINFAHQLCSFYVPYDAAVSV